MKTKQEPFDTNFQWITSELEKYYQAFKDKKEIEQFPLFANCKKKDIKNSIHVKYSYE